MKRLLYLVLVVAILLSISGVSSATIVTPSREGHGMILDPCYVADRGNRPDLAERYFFVASLSPAIVDGLCIPGPP